eukprot:TRINITY_DN27656_c0_g1_i1.p1 TRINITY_DN27656_c0_g1~~TRINITY_DN27656_c0_g1_i1.p1  ORF type:complete len:434 (+),score=69.21 TRINITY_DN27656_c0_g1_i1:80-1381(+)
MGDQRESVDRRKKNTNTSVGETRVLLTAISGERGPPAGAAEEFFWLYSQFGKVEKISIFKKKKLQIFTQFSSPSECSRALSCLNGSVVDMFHTAPEGPYTFSLAALPSFLVEVTFSKTNSRNCDYSKENIAIDKSIKEGVIPPKSLDFLWNKHVKGDGWLVPKQPEDQRGRIPERTGIPKGSKGDCAYISGLPDDSKPEERFTVEQVYRIASMFGKVLCARKVKKRDGGTFLIQFDDKPSCTKFIDFMSSVIVDGTPLRVEESVYDNTMFWINSGAHEIQANIFVPEEGSKDAPQPLPDDFLQRMKISYWVGVQGVDECVGYKLLEDTLKKEVDQADMLDPELSPTPEPPAVAGPLTVIGVLRVIGSINGRLVSGNQGPVVAYFLQVPVPVDDPSPDDITLDDDVYDAHVGRSVTDVFPYQPDYPLNRATTQY